MSFDYYASLAEQKICPPRVNKCGLASGFVDGCAWSFASAEIDRAEAEQKEKKAQKNSQEEKDAKKKKKEAENRKNDARRCYMKRASELALEGLKLLQGLNFDPDFSQLSNSSWFGIEVEFTLLSPWYSKDDRPFHVLDNPVRKDRIFGVPFMSASSWKGLLRWACRMQAGLYGHLESHGMKLDRWEDPPWIVHLFGNVQAEGNELKFSRGALMFYPTWFDKVGFEVINPHSRKTRAGIHPIYYEVVPVGTKGKLQLLYAPLPGETRNDKVKPVDVIDNLIDGITALLETYGISAKRTAGWGTTQIDMWTGLVKASDQPARAESRPAKKILYSLQELGSLVSDQNPSGSFTSKDAEGFKAGMKSRIARKGGGQ